MYLKHFLFAVLHVYVFELGFYSRKFEVQLLLSFENCILLLKHSLITAGQNYIYHNKNNNDDYFFFYHFQVDESNKIQAIEEWHERAFNCSCECF